VEVGAIVETSAGNYRMTESGGVLLSNKPGKNSGNPGKNTNTVAPTGQITPIQNAQTGQNGIAGREVSSYGFIWPLDPVEYPKVSNSYGVDRGDLGNNVTSNHPHRGEDISLKGRNGKAEVFAIADGEVISVGFTGSRGYFVVIQHTEYQSVYQHLHSITITMGVKAFQGDVIGLGGSTGASTGPHLHIEILKGSPPLGRGGEPNFSMEYHVSPREYLPLPAQER
jgi:murein DD-endopeptidase MepM/ murein hydrolase activator NlpD